MNIAEKYKETFIEELPNDNFRRKQKSRKYDYEFFWHCFFVIFDIINVTTINFCDLRLASKKLCSTVFLNILSNSSSLKFFLSNNSFSKWKLIIGNILKCNLKKHEMRCHFKSLKKLRVPIRANSGAQHFIHVPVVLLWIQLINQGL